MEYRLWERSDEELLEMSDRPIDEGIALSLKSTGYNPGEDEVLELAIADFQGNVLFSKRVKPQNVEEWEDGGASGGIVPADVADLPELYQFEDEISSLFENASVVVAEHLDFAESIIERSWVALPSFDGFDLIERFCQTHSAADYPDEPAAAASLAGICDYYGIDRPSGDCAQVAVAVGLCYRKLIEEHAALRIEKGAAYWQAYRERLEEAERNDVRLQAAKRSQAVRDARINAILWLGGAAIFSNLAVQMHLRGFDFGVVILVAAVAVFCAARWIHCLYRMYKLRK